MGRPLRTQLEDATYHVTTRGIRKLPVYDDATDRQFWLATLAATVVRYEWICHSYCQMSNHFHLCVETPKANIAAGMHFLNSEHAHWFNKRHGFKGHVFEARYYSRVLKTDEQFVDVARYIALNPVRAGLCANAQDWPWSSYAGTVGETPSSTFVSDQRLLAHFDDDPACGRTLFRALVEAGARDLVRSATSVPGTGMTEHGVPVSAAA